MPTSSTRRSSSTCPPPPTPRSPTPSGLGTITDDDGFAVALDQRRDGDRGERRHGDRGLHRQPLSSASGQTVTVDFATADGTAVAGADYTLGERHGQLPGRPGRRRSPSRSPATSSTRSTRRFTVTLSNPTNATIADGTGLGTITDDDPTPTLVDQRRDRHRGRQRHRRPRPSPSRCQRAERPRRHGRLRDRRTARRPRRPTTRRGTGTPRPSPPARPRSTVTVLVNGDTLDEANETFTVNLVEPDQRDDRRRQRHRHDHRRRPAADALDQRRDGDRGQHRHRRPPTFTVTLSARPAARPSRSTPPPPNGTATAPGDYTRHRRHADLRPRRDDADHHRPGQRRHRSTRRTRRSSSTSPAPSNATIADGQGLGTITDDDPPPSLVDRRRDGDRGRRRHDDRDLHRHPQLAERPDGDGPASPPRTARRRAPRRLHGRAPAR